MLKGTCKTFFHPQCGSSGSTLPKLLNHKVEVFASGPRATIPVSENGVQSVPVSSNSVFVEFLKHSKSALKHKWKDLLLLLNLVALKDMSVIWWILTTGFTGLSMKGKRKKTHPDKFTAGSTYAARNIFAYIFHTQHMAVIQIARAKC